VVSDGEPGDDRRLRLFHVWLANAILIVGAGHTSDELTCDNCWEYPDNTVLSSMQRRSLVRKMAEKKKKKRERERMR